MIAAQMAQQIVRAAHEVTEEREVITEVTTEQIEVIKKPEVTETVTTQIRKEVKFSLIQEYLQEYSENLQSYKLISV